MNRAMQARILVVVFWAVGIPLTVLSFVAIPHVLSAGPLSSRAAWAAVPLLGLLVIVSCIRTLLRMDARAGGARFDRQWLGRYYVEALIAFVVYISLTAVAVKIAPTAHDHSIRVLAGLAPSAGMALIIAAIVRWVRRADDYHRARLLESFAVTAAVTAFWTSGYSFLEVAGFPRLHAFWIPVGMAATWLAWSAGRALPGR
jgi:hypothetical protein